MKSTFYTLSVLVPTIVGLALLRLLLGAAAWSFYWQFLLLACLLTCMSRGLSLLDRLADRQGDYHLPLELIRKDVWHLREEAEKRMTSGKDTGNG